MMLYLKNINLQKILQFLLCLFLFLLPWQTIWIYRESFLNGVKWEYGTLGFYATEILLWVIVVLFMIWFWKNWKLETVPLRRRNHAVAWGNWKLGLTKDRIFVFSCLLFTVYYFLSIIWSPDKTLALQQSLRVMEAVLLFLVIFIGPFEKEKLAKWFVYGAILPALLGIWQFLAQTTFASAILGLSSHPVWEAGTAIIQSDSIGRWLRAYGPFAHPNVFGGYLVVAIILLLSLRADPPVGGEAKQSPTSLGLLRRFAPRNDIFIYCLLITALFFTFSRSAWAAFAVVTLLHCYIAKKYHFIILSVIIFIIFSFIYFPLVQTRLSSQSISEIRSTEERVSGYQEAWSLFRQHPLLGVGAGNYTLALYQQNPNRPGWEYQPTHNVFALFVAEEGVVGVILVLFIVISFFKFQISNFPRHGGIPSSQRDKFQIGDWYVVVFLFFCFIVLMFFDHYLYSSYVGLMLGAVFFGLLIKNNTQKLPS